VAEKEFWSRVPWSSQPSLKLKAEEIGVDFEVFVEGLKNNRSDQDMARAFGVPVPAVANLRRHFMRFGLDSVQGQD